MVATIVLAAILGVVTIVITPIVFWYLLERRKIGLGGKDAAQLREQLAALRSDYEQLKADHNDMLLGLNAGMRRMEARLDQHLGIDAPAPDTTRREPPQRQL